VRAARWIVGAGVAALSLGAGRAQAVVVHEATRALSLTQSWMCADAGSLGRQFAEETLAARGLTCHDILAEQRALLVPLFAAADFATTSLTQQCWLSGYREELTVTMTRFVEECSDQLTRGFQAGVTLGKLACRHAPLDAEAPELRVAHLELSAFDPNGERLILREAHPLRSARWSRQITGSHADGFLVGCLLGERELLSGGE